MHKDQNYCVLFLQLLSMIVPCTETQPNAVLEMKTALTLVAGLINCRLQDMFFYVYVFYK